MFTSHGTLSQFSLKALKIIYHFQPQTTIKYLWFTYSQDAQSLLFSTDQSLAGKFQKSIGGHPS